MYILKILDSQITNNILTLITICLGIYGYKQWKFIHVAERQSNSLFIISSEINKLYFSILEQRQPEFRPDHTDEFIKYIEKNKIPPLWEIAKHSYVISKEISILEKTLNLPKINNIDSLSTLYYRNIFEAVVKDITLRIHLYFAEKKTDSSFDPAQTDLYKFLYPASFVTDPDKYETDEKTGLNIIKDELCERITNRFEIVTNEVNRRLIK
jgi:hypothetical protein